MIEKEIERKFLIDKFPENLEFMESSFDRQGYISTSPVVRIRHKKYDAGKESFTLCFKGKGSIERTEIEIDINEDEFIKLKKFIDVPLVTKRYMAFKLKNNLILECSLVDEELDTAFYYAEVEFDDIKEAKAFLPPEFLGKEVTGDFSYTMAGYWNKTRIDK